MLVHVPAFILEYEEENLGRNTLRHDLNNFYFLKCHFFRIFLILLFFFHEVRNGSNYEISGAQILKYLVAAEGPWCQILSFILVFLESIDLYPRKEDTETNLGQIYLSLSRFIYDQENSFLLSHKGQPRIKIEIITC